MKYTDKLIIVVSALVLTAFALTLPSFGRNQNANSSTTRSQDEQKSAPDFSKNTWELPADAEKTKNPVSATDESIGLGKGLFLERAKGNCVFCHGPTGSGNEANLPRLRRKPADLANKKRMESMTDGEIFWKISKGIEGIMPAGEKRMIEEERWHLVNYVRTLAKEPGND